jgi:hypothetical protein
MATNELRELRHKYKAAYTTYLSCVQALSEASQQGCDPPLKCSGKNTSVRGSKLSAAGVVGRALRAYRQKAWLLYRWRVELAAATDLGLSWRVEKKNDEAPPCPFTFLNKQCRTA